MRSTVVVVVLCLMVAMVTCQKRLTKKCKKLDKMEMKLNKLREMEKCPQTKTWSACTDVREMEKCPKTWSACTDGNITVTYELQDPNTEDCEAKPAETMECVQTETFTKKGCDITKTMDYSECATSNKFEMTIVNACKNKEKTIKRPCDSSRKQQKKLKKGIVDKIEKKYENLKQMCESKKDMTMDKEDMTNKKANKKANRRAKKKEMKRKRKQERRNRRKNQGNSA